MASKSRKNSSGKPPALYRPEFQTEASLPPIDDFRLHNILSKTLAEETSAVSAALDEVTHNYQSDLKREIRHTLTTEQKIQYKNINAIKSAHELHHQWQTRKKRHLRATRPGEGYRKTPTLGDEVGKLHREAHAVSASVRSLALRLAEADRRRGGPGVPDAEKYPKLARIFASFQPQSARPQAASEAARPAAFPSAKCPSVHAVKSPSVHAQCEPAAPKGKDAKAEAPVASESESDMDPETFEMIMDMNIAKYRQKLESKHAAKPEKVPRNPIKLLATAALDVQQDIGMEAPDTFKSLFLPIKSNATVVESPQLSLHKKLRIKALPPSHRDERLRAKDVDPKVMAESLESIFHESMAEEGVVESSSESESSDSSLEEPGMFMPEPENTRHQPSHRILKPKQSILKLSQQNIGLRKQLQAEHLGPKSPLEAFASYRASPKSSFINEYSAMGVILSSRESHEPAPDTCSEESSEYGVFDIDEDVENHNAATKLRQLLI